MDIFILYVGSTTSNSKFQPVNPPSIQKAPFIIMVKRSSDFPESYMAVELILTLTASQRPFTIQENTTIQFSITHPLVSLPIPGIHASYQRYIPQLIKLIRYFILFVRGPSASPNPENLAFRNTRRVTSRTLSKHAGRTVIPKKRSASVSRDRRRIKLKYVNGTRSNNRGVPQGFDKPTIA